MQRNFQAIIPIFYLGSNGLIVERISPSLDRKSGLSQNINKYDPGNLNKHYVSNRYDVDVTEEFRVGNVHLPKKKREDGRLCKCYWMMTRV